MTRSILISLFTDPENAGRIRKHVAWKQKQLAPDMVIVSDNAALEFIRTELAPISSQIPVVLCGINHFPGALGRSPVGSLSTN